MSGELEKPKSASHQSKGRKVVDAGEPIYQVVPSPFDGLTRDEMADALRAMGEDYERVYAESLEDLQVRILNTHPLILLSMLAFHSLTMPLGEESVAKLDSQLGQPDIEFLQALILRHPAASYAWKHIPPPDVQVLVDLLQQVGRAFSMRRLSGIDKNMRPDERSKFGALECMRIHTQGIRNWGYPEQTARLMTMLFASIDDEIEKEMGIRICHLVTMGMEVIARTEAKLNAHWGRLRTVMQAGDICSMAEAYCQAFPDISGPLDSVVATITTMGLDLEETKLFLLSHSSFCLPDIFTHTIDDFVSAYPTDVDVHALSSIIRRWSLRFGDLATGNTGYFFMDNPIWRKPLIRIDEQTYCWPIVCLFLSFGPELMEELIADHPTWRGQYEGRRAAFLEDETERLFRAAFPDAKVYRGSKWFDSSSGKQYENDLLVQVDSHILVVEAKSARVAEPARRGAEQRLRRVVDDLMIVPSVQSQRFAEYLRDHPAVHRFSTKRGVTNEVDTREVYRIGRISVTLDRIADLIAQSELLQRAGMISPDIDICPTICIADLENVFALLDGTCQRLHYLIRRAEVQKRLCYQGDESDLLGWYMQTAFNVDYLESAEGPIIISSMSELIGPYFIGRESGVVIPKPILQMTDWWRDLLARFEQVRHPHWTELGYLLLSVSYSDQQHFEQEFARIQDAVLQCRQARPDTDTVILASGPEQHRTVVIGFAYKDTPRATRNEWMSQVAGEAMERAGADRAVVLGIDVLSDDYPYSVSGLCVPHSTNHVD